MVLTQEEGRHPGGGDGIIARTLFTYGKTAPAVPRITARRRIHHPSPGPHDQPVGGGEVLADPQKPPIVDAPTSSVAGPRVATIGEKRGDKANPRAVRVRVSQPSVGIR